MRKPLLRFTLMASARTRNRTAAGIRLRSILQSELARRKKVNRSYSLRAFARSVEVEHSTLSQLLRGKRAMTWKSIQTIASTMRWTGSSVLNAAGEGKKFDSRRISRRLGVSVDDVNMALTDLCLFGLIELKGD